MGLSTCSIPVKHKAPLPEYEIRFGAFPTGTTINGWTVNNGNEGQHICLRDKIYPTTFTKGTHVVYLVNESEYESVGEVDNSAFSDDKDSLLQFLSDFQFKADVEEDTTVQQTM